MAHGEEKLPTQSLDADIRTYPLGFQVGIPTEGQVLFPDAKALFDYQVIGFHYFIGSGTCDITCFVDADAIVTNESDANGVHNVSVGAGRVDATPDDYIRVLNGQDLTVLVDNISSPVQLVVRFELRRLPVNLDRGVQQHFVEVAAEIDTYIDSAAATTVQGAGVILNLHQGTGDTVHRHILMKFDLAPYSSSTILSAILHMHAETQPAENHTFEVRRLIEGTTVVLTEDETTYDDITSGVAWPGGAGGIGDTDPTVPTPVVLPVVPSGILVDVDYVFADLTAFAVDALALRGSQVLLHITQNGNTSEDLKFHSKENASGVLFEPKLWLVHEH